MIENTEPIKKQDIEEFSLQPNSGKINFLEENEFEKIWKQTLKKTPLKRSYYENDTVRYYGLDGKEITKDEYYK